MYSRFLLPFLTILNKQDHKEHKKYKNYIKIHKAHKKALLWFSKAMQLLCLTLKNILIDYAKTYVTINVQKFHAFFFFIFLINFDASIIFGLKSFSILKIWQSLPNFGKSALKIHQVTRWNKNNSYDYYLVTLALKF